MESDGGSRDSVHEQLREMERGETASWVVYPPTPVWWAVAYGLWAAAFAVVVGLLEGPAPPLSQLGLTLMVGVTAVWDRRRRGTYPVGRPPREFNGAIVRMLIGVAAVGALAWLAGEQVSVWLAAAIAGVGTFAVVSRYEQEYAAIAARMRERLR